MEQTGTLHSEQFQGLMRGKASISIRKHKLAVFFIFSLLLSWLVWVPMALHSEGVIIFDIPLLVGSTVGAFGPLISLILLEKITKKEVDVNKIYSSITTKMNAFHWLAAAGFIFPLLTTMGNMIGALTISELSFSVIKPEIESELGLSIALVMPGVFLASLLTSPLLEEPCWRGFALTKLQERYGGILGSLMLGSFWWLWHQPIQIATGISSATLSITGFVLWISQSCILDSFYNSSGRNLLVAMFCHSSMYVNYTFMNFCYSPYVLIVTGLFALILRIVHRPELFEAHTIILC